MQLGVVGEVMVVMEGESYEGFGSVWNCELYWYAW